MRKLRVCLIILATCGPLVTGCGEPTAATAQEPGPANMGTLELSQDVPAGRATGNRLTLITRVLDTRWYYAVLWYRSGAQRVVPVELQSDRAVVVVTGYPGEAEFGQLKKVKVYSRPVSDLDYTNPPFRYHPLPDGPSKSLVLMHGYVGTEISLRWMQRALSPLYDHVFLYAYEYNDYLAASGARLMSWLTDLNIVGPDKRCDIVAHSLGGLVAREAIEHRGLSTYVDNLVTLGTSHLGNTLAATPVVAPIASLLLDRGNWTSGNYFADLYHYFFNATGHLAVLADVNPASPFLASLNEPSGTSCVYLTIAGNLPEWGGDLVVTPNNANWDGLAEEAAVHESRTLVLGHSQLLSHQLACQTVKELLQERQ